MNGKTIGVISACIVIVLIISFGVYLNNHPAIPINQSSNLTINNDSVFVNYSIPNISEVTDYANWRVKDMVKAVNRSANVTGSYGFANFTCVNVNDSGLYPVYNCSWDNGPPRMEVPPIQYKEVIYWNASPIVDAHIWNGSITAEDVNLSYLQGIAGVNGTSLLPYDPSLNMSQLLYDGHPVQWVYQMELPVGDWAVQVVPCIMLVNGSRICEVSK